MQIPTSSRIFPSVSASTPDDLLRAREPAGGRTVMYQTWRNLLFLHWKSDPAALLRLIPDELEIDTFDGDTYIGIVPFYMCGVRPRFLPPMPGLSNFLELNVRTYVRPKDGGPPGVWFFSLDANCRPAVWAARRFFHLPYFHAQMTARRDRADSEGERGGDWIDYRCRRRSEDKAEPDSHFRYRADPDSPSAREAEPGALEFFLLERYWLYAHDPATNRLFKGQVAHQPYRFRNSQVAALDTFPISRLGADLLSPATPPVHTCVTDDVPVRILGISAV